MQKFLNLEKDNNAKLSLILEAIKKETGIEIKKENIEITGNNLRLKTSPIVRNEIFMHRSQIEESLKSSKIFLKLI